MASPKSNQKNSLDFVLDLAGLELFFNESSNQHYFRFNDESGQAILHSQGYSSEKSCERGFVTAVKNFNTPRRVQKESGLNGNYFVILAGNNQKMAQSPAFESRAEMERALTYLKAVFNPNLEKEKPKAKTTSTAKKQLKHSFRVDFYQASKSSGWRGRIEYPLTQEKTSLPPLLGTA